MRFSRQTYGREPCSGMGKKGSPSQRFKVREIHLRLSLVQLSISPGYMLTKLTKTVLEHDQERKVGSFCPFYRSFHKILPFLFKKTWEDLTPMGRVGYVTPCQSLLYSTRLY
jgi:hypothetical protein